MWTSSLWRFSEEQLMMRDSVKEFVEKIMGTQRSFWKKIMLIQWNRNLGLLGVAVPEAYGGLGMGFVSTMLVCDYISGATGSFSTAFGAHTGIGTMP
jgi:alkylation response protein AidB-like acyl-CoA dehydrogenase